MNDDHPDATDWSLITDQASRGDEKLDEWKRTTLPSGQFRIWRMFFWTSLVAAILSVPQFTGSSPIEYVQTLWINAFLFIPMVTLGANCLLPTLSKRGRVTMSLAGLGVVIIPVLLGLAGPRPSLFAFVVIAMFWFVQTGFIAAVWYFVFSKQPWETWRRLR